MDNFVIQVENTDGSWKNTANLKHPYFEFKEDAELIAEYFQREASLYYRVVPLLCADGVICGHSDTPRITFNNSCCMIYSNNINVMLRISFSNFV